MYRYLAVEKRTQVENEERVTYGILIKGVKNDGYISDVFADGDVAERFAKMCTDAQLDPIHLFDVLEDMF